MNERTERPEREQRHDAHRVDLVDQRRVRHLSGVRGHHEDSPEPRRDGLAVVVAAAEQVRAHRGVHARGEHDCQQHEGQRPQGRSRVSRASGTQAASHEHHKAGDRDRSRRGTQGDRDNVIRVLGYAGGLRDRLRHEDADDVAADDRQQTDVEEDYADAPPGWRGLALGARRERQFAGPVAPDVPDDERRQAGVRNDEPQHHVHT